MQAGRLPTFRQHNCEFQGLMGLEFKAIIYLGLDGEILSRHAFNAFSDAGPLSCTAC